jgi:hypothetical protein
VTENKRSSCKLSNVVWSEVPIVLSCAEIRAAGSFRNLNVHHFRNCIVRTTALAEKEGLQFFPEVERHKGIYNGTTYLRRINYLHASICVGWQTRKWSCVRLRSDAFWTNQNKQRHTRYIVLSSHALLNRTSSNKLNIQTRRTNKF